MPPLSLRQLHYGLAAAEAGNVTAAARRLNVSQPAISAAIAALESHYGTPLFTRQHGQGVGLTGFGRALFPEIRNLLKEAAGISGFGKAERPVAGEVTLAIYEALAPYYLPALLTRLEKDLPSLRITYREDTLDGMLAGLKDGSADLAITYDVGLDTGFAAATLYELQPFILMHPRHALARARAVRLKELKSQCLVLLDQPASANYVLGLLHGHGVEPQRILRAGSFELQRSFVANGMGVALSHTRPRIDAAYDGKRLMVKPIADALPPQRVVLASAKRHRATRAAEAAAEAIERHFTLLPRPEAA
ncbi:LysR family transcriptional regulator [Aestuariivirga sp.]|uniref:LysR family transcriptional regulator n=1 Tax=Aestuariivirga sp. TaxID=2650926 RepID=UPI0039E6E09D